MIENKETWIPRLEREKKAAHRCQIGALSSQTSTQGHFNPLLKKRRRNSEKAVSHKLIHPVLHPYLNSSVHFAQFSADPDNIPNMTRSCINSSPRYVAERKRHFWLFSLPLNLGSEVTTVEKVEEAVCHRKPCLQKSRILSQRDKQGKQLSVHSAVMFFCSETFTGWLPALCTAIAVCSLL